MTYSMTHAVMSHLHSSFEALRISNRLQTFKSNRGHLRSNRVRLKIVILKNRNRLSFHFEIFPVIKIENEYDHIGYGIH